MTDPAHVPPDAYTALVTSEHNQRPKFMAWLATLVQTFSDQISLLLVMPSLFDLDYAVGVQLDATGEWIGQSRWIKVPLQIYFTWDDDGTLGWDAGVWYTPFDATEGLYRLPDDQYRLVLKAKVGSNQWDGTIPQAYEIYHTLFAGTGTTIAIQDNQNMSMSVIVLGDVPNAVNEAILTSGLLDLRPSAVKVEGYYFPTVRDAPYFGFDIENDSISGWDSGAWGRRVPGKN
jgi:hypothetical protein